jgi:dTDP-glucose 4,6-dehydratase
MISNSSCSIHVVQYPEAEMALDITSIASSPPLPLEDLHLVLERTIVLWEEMRGQSLFITGGTGFFGCWLVETFCYINRMLNLDARITVLTRSPQMFQTKCPHLATDPSLKLVAGDIRDFVFPQGEFRYIVHAATETSPEPTVEAQFNLLDSITRGTERSLQFAATHGTQKFLFISSGAVYGRQPSHIVHLPETYCGAPDPLDLSSAYGEGKRLAELLCAFFGRRHGFECKIARCWAFCGPHLPLDRHFAIGNFIADALADRTIRITGDGTPRRSYLYAADLTIWLWTMLFRAPPLIPINVGSEHDISILELARVVASVLNPGIQVEVATAALPGASPQRYVSSVACARELLGLQQIVGLEDAIRKTADWHRKRSYPQAG